MTIVNEAQQDDRPLIRVLLYTLITTANQQTRINRTLLAWLRNRLVRIAYLTFWKLTGKWKGTFWAFEDVRDSNLGDIAVRMGVTHALENAFPDKRLEIHEVPWGALKSRLACDSPYNFDLIVIGGGGYLFANPQNHLPKRIVDDTEALSHAKCPVVATSIGINQLIQTATDWSFAFHPDQAEVISQFVSRQALFSVRDRTAKSAITAVGARAPFVVVDPAFLLAKPDPNIGPPCDGVIDVGLNIPFHGHFASKLSRRSLSILVGALKKLAETTPCRFHYFCHVDSAKGIVSALRMRGIKVNVVGGSVDELIAGYRKLHIHVGSMMHSTILAMSVGVPTLALAYDIKSMGFFELFGLENLVKPIDTLDEDRLFAAIVELVSNRHDVAAVIEQRSFHLRTDATNFYAKVAQLVNRCLWIAFASVHALV